MTITVARLLRHMAWANQETIKHLQALPEESLKSYATNPEWFVAEIIHHIVDSADHYVLSITGKPAITKKGDPCIADIENLADLTRLAEQAAAVDGLLVAAADLDDVWLDLENDSGKFQRLRSTVLSQAIHHATEHRAHIASALEAKGFEPINLDDISLWDYETYETANGLRDQ
jgi:uncharacterized damage-inducible protein DinB